MKEYDFHSLLDDYEFESLAVDIIRVRENLEPNMIRRYPKGRDGGIDGYGCEDGMIIQAKCFKEDFNSLFNQLKKFELPKVKCLNPSRYVLVTAVALTKNNQEKIKQVFKDYIHSEEDIIGKIELNEYLASPKYHDLEYKYHNLWMPSTSILEHLLENTVFREQYNFQQCCMNDFSNNVEYFIKTESYYKSIEMLDLHNCLLIFGEPGIGKTILGYNMVFHYMTKDAELKVFFTDCIESIFKLYKAKDKQLFIVDDFFGINYVNKQAVNGESKIYLMLKTIIDGKNHKLILITRKNIFIEGLDLLPDLRKIMKNMSIELSQNSLKREDKTKILWSILKKSNLSHNDINSVIMCTQYIIYNENYNPRLIKDVLDYIIDTPKGDVIIREVLRDTLTNPDAIYDKMFESLSRTSISAVYLGCLLAIFEESVEISILQMCYAQLQGNNNQIEWLCFDDALNQLSFLFCSVRVVNRSLSFYGSKEKFRKTIVAFNNHSIMRYWCKVISKKLIDYGANIIKSVDLMNVIIFFTDKLTRMKLINAENNYQYIQIIPEIVNKILKDYEKMDFIYLEDPYDYSENEAYFEIYFASGYTNSKILKIKQVLDINKTFKPEQLRIVIENLKVNFFNCLLSEDVHALSEEEKYSIPKIIDELIKQRFTIPDVEKILDSYFAKINFLKYFKVFYEFKYIFGADFDHYIQIHNNEIVSNIFFLIYDDFDYYESDMMDLEKEVLFDDVTEVLKMYGIKIQREQLKDIKWIEEQINLGGYSVKWNNNKYCFEEVGRYSLENEEKKPDDIIELGEFDERGILQELLPYNYYGEIDDWDLLVNLSGTLDCEVSILEKIHQDLFLGGSKWKDDYYNFEPLFLARIIDEYKNGRKINNSISDFFNKIFEPIDPKEHEILTKIAMAAKEKNEDFFSKNNLKTWINISP